MDEPLGRDYAGSMRSLITILVLAVAATPATTQEKSGLDPVLQDDIKQAVARISAETLEVAVRKLVSFGTRHTFSDTQSPSRGIGAARRWLKSRFEEISKETGGRLEISFEEYPVPQGRRRRRRPLPEGAKVVNVVARLPGTEAGRVLIVSGHYDSRASRGSDATSDAPGADDDASGVAVVLEAARVMGGIKPRATVLFVAYDGEEHGLWGSGAHATKLRSDAIRVAAMITNDIVGGVVGSDGKREPNRVRLFSEGNISGPPTESGRARSVNVGSDNDSPSRQLARYMRRRGLCYAPSFDVTLIFRQDRFGRGGDHRSFNRQGFAAVRFTEPHENFAWQHQDVRVEDGKRFGDLPENLGYDFVQRVAQVNVAGLMELALAPAAPRQVRMIRRPAPHTVLRWKAVEAKDLAGYASLYRRTHEPFWTHRRALGKDQTSATMEALNKDDWLFAVEAFDTKGRRSLPVYPRPSSR